MIKTGQWLPLGRWGPGLESRGWRKPGVIANRHRVLFSVIKMFKN